jgi:hypothetical protein
MFLSVNQSIETDNDYNRPRCTYHEPVGTSTARISIAFGYVNSLTMSIDEAKRLFLELEVSLREAYDDEDVSA